MHTFNLKAMTAALAFTAFAAPAFADNGAPSGSHYNLNIIGVPHDKTADMTGTQGHTIFVALTGKSTIHLCESGADANCGSGSYEVLDRNATDANGALLALPNPDVDGDGTTTYSVFARALGKPGGGAKITTCATQLDDPTTPLVDESGVECSLLTLELKRDTGQSKFDNVTKYLLYIYADIDEDGDVERVPLFADGFENFLWGYDNNGLRLAQLRFYPCSSTVPSPTSPTGPTTSTCNP
jgi:hypothetical protein